MENYVVDHILELETKQNNLHQKYFQHYMGLIEDNLIEMRERVSSLEMMLQEMQQNHKRQMEVLTRQLKESCQDFVKMSSEYCHLQVHGSFPLQEQSVQTNKEIVYLQANRVQKDPRPEDAVYRSTRQKTEIRLRLKIEPAMH